MHTFDLAFKIMEMFVLWQESLQSWAQCAEIWLITVLVCVYPTLTVCGPVQEYWRYQDKIRK